jgi:hypothetical protein
MQCCGTACVRTGGKNCQISKKLTCLSRGVAASQGGLLYIHHGKTHLPLLRETVYDRQHDSGKRSHLPELPLKKHGAFGGSAGRAKFCGPKASATRAG